MSTATLQRTQLPPTPMLSPASVLHVDLESTLEHHRTTLIGQTEYSFFHPIVVGPFVAHIYTSGGPADLWCNSTRYAVSLYENGRIVEPRLDQRLRRCSWARLPQDDLTRDQLLAMLVDLRATRAIAPTPFFPSRPLSHCTIRSLAAPATSHARHPHSASFPPHSSVSASTSYYSPGQRR
mmetsp:Transcript_45305/g.114063  ORF Transcript_45305/g.114063 Transcript_45305/m.114063 type:complete len:180 (-) Transcript_45305:145-684(-)|eukprot:CAMPEP_0177660812 /NCGR_PEP_ID=MMETSP0447-20121125/18272_1 /TAXON_ID=0 /ORGANISM="Stygamoeba regulata, Strain BSH-02190019" /LENGTH=179 /DNA_ID=CAMNT_0019165967 /DNA_START=109 /DNA_END=648 /DNA_ORIENTATION=+